MAELFIYRKRPDIGRYELSRQVFRAWNWGAPNGHLKDIICRGVTLKLKRAGFLKLPPRKFTPNNPLAKRKPPKIVSVPQYPICATVKNLSPVILRQARKIIVETPPEFNS